MRNTSVLLTVLVAITLAQPLHVRAQGNIQFVNNSQSYIVTNSISIGGASGRAKTDLAIRVQLYYGVAGSSESQLVPFGTPIGLSPVPGVFNGGLYNLTGIPDGADATFQVRAWTGGYSSFDAAVLVYTSGESYVSYNKSPLWTQATGSTGGVPPYPVAMVNGPTGFNGLVLTIVPEPSAYALFGMGLLGLCVRPLRRFSKRSTLFP